jgi:hypothetical protein
MTDQDPTQPYQPPAAPAAPAPPAATPPAPPAVDAPPASYAPPASSAPTASYAPPASHPAVEPIAVPTAPVSTAPTGDRPGRSRVKWLVAAVAVLLVAGTAAAATLMLTASSGASPVTGWAPADTVTYSELRLDLPGSQQAELATFMSAFPGFDDQAAFPTKLGEIGDKIVQAASDGKHSYQTEIAPWFGGSLAVAQGPSPSMDDLESGSFDVRALVIVHVLDGAKATAWVDGIVAETKSTTKTETYDGTTITIVEPDAGDMGISLPEAGYALLDKVLIAGDVTSIKAAIDSKGQTGLSASEPFKAAQAALPGDHIAFMFADYKSSLLSSFDQFESFDDSGMIAALSGIYGEMLPPWAAVSVRAADGRLVVDSVLPHVAALGDATNKVDAIAAMAPADTVFLATGHDVGARLQAVKAMFDDEPAFEEVLKQIDQALGLVGGFSAATGWIGDTGIVITRQGEAVDGGLVISPADGADAERLLTSLQTMVEIGAGSMLSFEKESYGGTTIVSLDLSAIAAMGAGMGGLPAESIPDDLTLAWAVANDVVVMGVGPQFVKDVLDARTGDSLAKQARYSTLVGAAGNENAGVVWVDMTSIRVMIEPVLPGEIKTQYETDVKPYLEPIDTVVGVTIAGETLDRSTMYLTVVP